MRIHEFIYESIQLLENRIDWLTKNIIPRIEQKLENNQLNIPAEIKQHLSGSDTSTQAQQLFQWILDQDPSNSKEYSQWLMNMVVRKKNPVPLEDFLYVKDTLTQFDEKKPELDIKQRNINSYKSISQLDAVIHQFGASVDFANEAEKAEAIQESDVIVDLPNWTLVHPKTENAARYWGRGSEWCTCWGDPKGTHPKRTSQYNTYKNGLYILRNKQNPEKSFQFQVKEQQYMDWNDDPVTYSDVAASLSNNEKQIIENKLIDVLIVKSTANGNDKINGFYKFFESGVINQNNKSAIDKIFKIITSNGELAVAFSSKQKKPWSKIAPNIANKVYDNIVKNTYTALEYSDQQDKTWNEISPQHADQAHDMIVTDTENAYNYSVHNKKTWNEISPQHADRAYSMIFKSSTLTYKYSRKFSMPWTEISPKHADQAHESIIEDPDYAVNYSMMHAKLWSELSPKLANKIYDIMIMHGDWAIAYSVRAKKTWHEISPKHAEKVYEDLLTDSFKTFKYSNDLKITWNEISPKYADAAYKCMLDDGNVYMIAYYAINFGKPWTELSPKYAKKAHSIILTNTYLSKEYSKEFGEDWKKDI